MSFLKKYNKGQKNESSERFRISKSAHHDTQRQQSLMCADMHAGYQKQDSELASNAYTRWLNSKPHSKCVVTGCHSGRLQFLSPALRTCDDNQRGPL